MIPGTRGLRRYRMITVVSIALAFNNLNNERML